MKNVSDIYPLSPMQELMLVHALSRPNADLLFNHVVFRLDGDLDVSLAERCWSDIVKRHPMLRTIFLWEELKAPVQVVRQNVQLKWENYDWRSLSADEQHDSLATLLREDRKKGFDLKRAPLIRFALCRWAENHYSLVWSSHHLVVDRWCIGLLLNEFSSLYEGYRTGVPPNFDNVHPYSEYIRWLGTQRTADAENFWREELAGVIRPQPVTPGTAAKEDTNSEELYRLDPVTTSRLRQFSAAHRLTLGTVVLGGWALLQGMVKQTKDLLLGITISGRPPALRGVDAIIGPFINNVPLRVSFSHEQHTVDWLKALQERQLAIQTYGFVSPQQIQEWSKISEAGSLFDTLFLYQSPVKMPSTSIHMTVEDASLQTHLPLTLAVEDDPDGLLLSFHYQSPYERETIGLLQKGILLALDLIAGQPNATPQQLMESLRQAMPPIKIKNTEQLQNIGNTVHRQPPRSGLENRMFKIWAEVLGHQSFGVQDNFFDIGGNSLLALRLFARIEQETGANLPLSAFFGTTTVSSVTRLIEDGSVISSWEILVPIQSQGSMPPFFAIHGVEGGVLGYRDLALALGDDQPFLGLQAMGLDGRQTYDSSIEAMASRYIEVMRSCQPKGPYRIGGYCFGGVVAYEMARQLERIGERVSLLAVFEGSMPEREEHRTPLIRRLPAIWKNLPVWIKDYSNMSPHQLVKRLRSTLKQVGSRLQRNQEVERRMRVEETLDINVDHLPRSHIEMTDACINAAIEYVPGEYNGVVTLFRARNRSINEVVFGSLDPKMGWGHLAKGGVQVRLVDGFHRNMHIAPYASSLASELRKCLGEDSRGGDLPGV